MARSHHCGGPARRAVVCLPIAASCGYQDICRAADAVAEGLRRSARGASPLRHARIFFVGPKLSGPCPTEHKMLPAKICDDAMLRAAQRLLMLRYRGPRETSTAKDPIVILFQVLEDFLAKMAPPARSTKITPRMLNDRWTQRVDAAGWACPYPRRPSACVAAATSHASVRAGRGARPAAATGTCGTLR